MAGILPNISCSANYERFAANFCTLPRGARRALQRKLSLKITHASLPRKLRRSLASSLAGAALLLAFSQATEAATITVTTNIPGINDGDNQCSLIEAIINANNDVATHPDCTAGDGNDTIILPSKTTMTLSGGYTDYYGSTALPPIATHITIEGNGSTIIRNALTSFRLFAVTGQGDLSLQDITISGGKEVGGGAIFNNGSLRITNSTISGNAATYGGGIYSSANGELWIDNTDIFNNTAVKYGGGVHLRGGFKITNSSIHNNSAGIFGGAVMNRAAGDGQITGVTVSNNTAKYGGGIANKGSSTISNTTISGNLALGDEGGGMWNGGTPSIRSRGYIENSTITANTARGASDRKFGQGGGVMNSSYGILFVKRSIISGNKAAAGPELSWLSPVIRVDYFNLFGASGYAGFDGFPPGPSDIVPGRGMKLKKILGPLKNNGGPTLTHALVPGSPAVDAAPADADCPATDQRGNPRPQGGGCDIGAVER